jgi:hypothetical protein
MFSSSLERSRWFVPNSSKLWALVLSFYACWIWIAVTIAGFSSHIVFLLVCLQDIFVFQFTVGSQLFPLLLRLFHAASLSRMGRFAHSVAPLSRRRRSLGCSFITTTTLARSVTLSSRRRRSLVRSFIARTTIARSLFHRDDDVRSVALASRRRRSVGRSFGAWLLFHRGDDARPFALSSTMTLARSFIHRDENAHLVTLSSRRQRSLGRSFIAMTTLARSLFRPSCLASSFCALLRAFVPCFGPLSLQMACFGSPFLIVSKIHSITWTLVHVMESDLLPKLFDFDRGGELSTLDLYIFLCFCQWIYSILPAFSGCIEGRLLLLYHQHWGRIVLIALSKSLILVDHDCYFFRLVN